MKEVDSDIREQQEEGRKGEGDDSEGIDSCVGGGGGIEDDVRKVEWVEKGDRRGDGGGKHGS